MDLKVYERTRYQNIYRNIKNKNYVIMMSKPIKSSISSIEGKKIVKLEEALKIRDDYVIRQQKALETTHKEDFDTLWNKYIDYGKYVKKLAFNTLRRKDKVYQPHLKNKITISLSKTTISFWTKFLDEVDTTLKEKNQLLKELKTFFNWCIQESYLITNPLNKVKKYKVSKTEMLYWTPNQWKQFWTCLNDDLNSENIFLKTKAYRVRTFSLIQFILGDRVGETRALHFNNFDKEKSSVAILHSINYDSNSKDFIGNTKTYESQRIIDVTEKFIDEILFYKNFLIDNLNLPIKSNSLIFFNYKTNRPLSDISLRKDFYYYCEKANVPKIRMYDLRHTYVATMMAEGKELYHISERIGHKDYATTVNKYGHLSNQVRKEVAQTTDKFF